MRNGRSWSAKLKMDGKLDPILFSLMLLPMGDVGFRYDPINGVCMNGYGQFGLNPDFLGECGDMSDNRHLNGQSFDGLRLRGTTFERSNIDDGQFVNSELRGVNFKSSSLRGTLFENGSVNRVLFDGADLRTANIINVDLIASFLGANMRGARLVGEAAIRGDFTGAYLDQSILSRAQFMHSEFNNTSMIAADLSYSRFYQCSFSGALLRNASFVGGDIRNSNFDNADLRGANLYKVQTNFTTFKGAIFDENTILPFDRASARRRGMIFKSR